MENTLIIFGRLPLDHLPAKTRLGKEMNDEFVARKIGHDLTVSTLTKYRDIRCEKIFCYGGEAQTEEEFLACTKKFSEYTFIAQEKNKDVRGLKEAFERSPGKRKICIGTDIIGITTEDIEDGFEILHHADIMIVPLEDKGYGLVGMSGNFDIFTDIKNFNSHTDGYDLIRETEVLCEKKNISLFISPKICFDIDTLEDYERISS